MKLYIKFWQSIRHACMSACVQRVLMGVIVNSISIIGIMKHCNFMKVFGRKEAWF